MIRGSGITALIGTTNRPRKAPVPYERPEVPAGSVVEAPAVQRTASGDSAKAAAPGKLQGVSRIKVLMYHRIVDDREISRRHWTCVHIDDFRRQLDLLDRWGFTPITFEDYRGYLRGDFSLPRKPAILTFDDGYSEIHSRVFPLLNGLGIRAVVFVLGDQRVRTNVWDAGHGLPGARLLEKGQILELHSAGWEVGSHSLTHPPFSALSDREAWEEISRSRILLEILLDAPVQTFSYPYGIVTEKAKRMVLSAGYDFACGVETGPASFALDPVEIRRVPVPAGISPASFAVRVLAPYEYYRWARWRLGAALKDEAPS